MYGLIRVGERSLRKPSVAADEIMTDFDPIECSLGELADALRDRETTAQEIAERVIANHDRLEGTLGAYKTWDADRLRRQAAAADAAFDAGVDLGPLQGLPVSIKDLYGVSGYPTFAGTPRQLPVKWEMEGEVVAAVRHNLAVVTGKTHTVEFAFGGVGTNAHWGAPRNPWDRETHRVPGGSSSGAGVSLHEGTAVLALGSDTAGSVRIPASLTGSVGIKTSVGRWDTSGIVPLSPTFDTAGILTRTVADAAIAFAAIDPFIEEPADVAAAQLMAQSPGDLRAGVCDWFFEDCSPGIVEGVQAAIAELERGGLKVERMELPELLEAQEIFSAGGLAGPEFAAFICSELEPWQQTLDPRVAARFEAARSLTAIDYLTRRNRLEELARSAAERLAAIDVLLTPTIAITPPPATEVEDATAYARHNMAILRNTFPGNLLRLCGLTMPVALDDAGMPVGLQVLAPLWEDERVLAAGLAFERLLGTARQRIGVAPCCRT